MSIFQARFSTGQVTSAAGVTNATLQTWLRRELIVKETDKGRIEGGGSPGVHRSYSWFSVMEIATAKALLDCTNGMDLKSTFSAARHFAHQGSGQSGWVDEAGNFVPYPNQRLPYREPGLPFPPEHGFTFLFVSGERSEVLPVPHGGNIDHSAVMLALGDPCGFVALDVSKVFSRVLAELGEDPGKVLKDAYRKADG